MSDNSFVSVVREQKSNIGKYGKITSKSLHKFVGKKVKVKIKEVKE